MPTPRTCRRSLACLIFYVILIYSARYWISGYISRRYVLPGDSPPSATESRALESKPVARYPEVRLPTNKSSAVEKTPSATIKDITSRECPLVVKPAPGVESQTFQPFHEKGHVFSAHYDYRERSIKVLGLSNRVRHRMLCRMWLESAREPLVVTAMEVPMPENRVHPLWSYQYKCPVASYELPYAVSIIRQKCDKAQNILYLKRRMAPRPNGTFTFCISPFFYEYDDLAQLVETIETARMFGGDYFVFYNLSIGPNVDKYLRHYMSIGIADVIQWHLPRGNRNNSYDGVYYFAQIATLSDCLLRNLGKSQFISFIDVDEIIVPRVVDNYSDLIKTYGHIKGHCSLLILNAFFRTEWPSNPRYAKTSAIYKYRMNTLLKTKREEKIWKPGTRSKYIARVVDLFIPTLHTPFICSNYNTKLVVSQEDALLHHYRSWGNPVVNDDAVEDTFMEKHSVALLWRIQGVHEAMGWSL